MAIKILAGDEIQPTASSFHIPALLFANPKNLYFRRAKRLRQLAENNVFKDYLLFAANLAEVQLDLLENYPIADYRTNLTACIEAQGGYKPLDAKKWQRAAEWRHLLSLLIEKFKPYATHNILSTLSFLEKNASSELEMMADHLLHQRFEQVPADQAVFLWGALSLYWVQLTQQLPRSAKAELGEERHSCPICDSAPITSVIHLGDKQSLRYLHCSLCETEWHMVRVKCTNCEQSRDLNYWSLERVDAAVKAESCGDCESYLKILYQEKDPLVEPLADDLASIFLDAEMEQKGFARSGLNPFLFQMDYA